MLSKVKTEPEEEPQPSTSGGGVQPERQPEVISEEQEKVRNLSIQML